MTVPVDEIDAPDAPVWYVSYGPAMSRARFVRALRGAPPRADMAVVLPGRVWFAESPATADGGVACYEHGAPGTAPARAYLITARQFADLRARETPSATRIVHLGEHDGTPMITFTARYGLGTVRQERPSERYLDALRVGLREAHGWDNVTISAYFARVLPAPPSGRQIGGQVAV